MDNKSSLGQEIAKKIPAEKIYDDLLRPSLSEIGQGLRDIIKLSLFPIKTLVWSYEKIADYLDQALTEYFKRKRIAKGKIQEPSLEIAVPSVEAMRYTKTMLREMYVNLLGASMNKDTADFVHPSFVNIISQLTPDEAKILKILPRKGLHEPLIDIEVEKQGAEGMFMIHSKCGILGFEAECEFPKNISLYMDNLVRLSLVNIPEHTGLADSWRYDKILDSTYFQTLRLDAESAGAIVLVKRMVGLTDYGAVFRDICLS